MSYPVAIPDRPRPTAVTAAGGLLYLVAALQAVSLIVSLATISTVINYLDTTYASYPNHNTIMTAGKVGVAVGIVLALAQIVLYIVLAVFDLRGRHGMRVATWVVASLGALCLGCGTFGNITGSAFQSGATGSQQATVNVRNLMPAWAVDTSTTVTVISMAALVAVIILLATSESNTYFRRTPPMMMYAGGSVYPISGTHPGPPYPTYPQQYGGPPPNGPTPSG